MIMAVQAIVEFDRFSKVLQAAGITCIVRRARGDDIDAACGQLVGDVKDCTKRLMKRECSKTMKFQLR